MAENGGYRPPPRAKNALDNSKLGLRAPNRAGKMASLVWSMAGNNPRITVYTNDPDDTVNYGRISSHLDLPMMYALLRLIRRAIETPEGTKYRDKIENKKYLYPNGKRSDVPEVTDSLIVGKNEDGLIWICVDAPRRPKIQFPFLIPDFHNLVHGDGSVFTQAESSKIAAESWVDMLSHLVVAVNVKEYVHPERKEDKRGNNNNRGGSGGGNSSSNNDFDDDIPW